MHAPRKAGLAGAYLVLVAASFAVAAHAESDGGLMCLLDPGSRPSLGLGGDPFLSPLDDEIGWWSSGWRRDNAWMRVDVSASVPVSRGLTGGEGNLSATETSWTMARPQRFLGRQWLLWSELANPRWDRSWEGGSGSIDFYGSTTRFEIGARVDDVLPGLTVQATLPAWESGGETRGSRFHVGLRYSVWDRLRVQGRWGRSEQPELLRLDLEGEPWAMSTNLASDERHVDGRLSLPLRFDVEGAFARADFGEVRAGDTTPVYHLTPGGRAESGHAALAWGLGRGHRFLYRWTHKSADTYGLLSWGGQRFGTLNYARGTIESRLAGAQWLLGARSRALLDYENAHLNGEARGYIETWPFTSTLIDLLGPRRIAKARADTKWTRLHAGFETAWRGGHVGRFGVSWYRVRPNALLDTWRPAFLVFGRADEKRTELSVVELQLLGISTGWRFRVGGVELDFAIQQFVPVHTAKRSKGAEDALDEPGTPDEGGESPSARRWSWPSGTSMQLSVTRSL